MAEVWSEAEPLYCLHPGWPLLTARRAVIQSWASILSGGGPTIVPEAGPVWHQGAVGLVLATGQLGGGFLAASNLFRLERGRWRLFHHQAGACHPTRMPQGRPSVMQEGRFAPRP